MPYSEFKQNRLCVTNSSSETVTFNDKIYEDEVGKVDLKKTDAISYGGKSVDYKKWGDNGEIYLSASIRNGEGGDRDKDNKAILRLNAMSYMRTISHFSLQDESHVVFFSGGTEKNANEATAAGYSIMYLALVIQTIMFLFIYGKRVLQMAFLTMIAPIVALMYPVDKLGDGKAQAFNTWFRDYLFNMLIQPMHLLLYTVFIVAAKGLVQRNILYALIVYGFMVPAEKYFKKMLGFEKASNGAGGPMGGAVGHSLAMDGLGRLAGIGPAAGGKGGSGGSSGGARRKPKIDKISPKGNTEPASSGMGSDSGTPATSGIPGAGGSGGATGSASGRRTGSTGTPVTGGSGGSKTSTAPSASGGNKNWIQRTGKALGTTMGKKAIRGATGGRYGNLADIKNPKAWQTAGKRLVGGGLRLAGKTMARGAGIAAMGGLGVIAGAATAMATGDINNLWKGASVGIAAGNKAGANIYGRAETFLDDVIAEEKMERANATGDYYDEDFVKDMRRDQTYDSMRDVLQNMSSTDYEKAMGVIDTMSPHVSISKKEDIEMLEQIMGDKGADGKYSNGLSVEEISNEYGDAKEFGSLSSKDNRDDYIDEVLSDPKKYNGVNDNRAPLTENLGDVEAVKNALKNRLGDGGLNNDQKALYKYMEARMDRVRKAQRKR